mmetsp:Transcript_153682/g.492671  ORF Transcript_153682/g.492671 Transcript_153682/m.492671 type:complete len:253 (+) Transcript_153682:265-1023(+)
MAAEDNMKLIQRIVQRLVEAVQLVQDHGAARLHAELNAVQVPADRCIRVILWKCRSEKHLALLGYELLDQACGGERVREHQQVSAGAALIQCLANQGHRATELSGGLMIPIRIRVHTGIGSHGIQRQSHFLLKHSQQLLLGHARSAKVATQGQLQVLPTEVPSASAMLLFAQGDLHKHLAEGIEVSQAEPITHPDRLHLLLQRQVADGQAHQNRLKSGKHLRRCNALRGADELGLARRTAQKHQAPRHLRWV